MTAYLLAIATLCGPHPPDPRWQAVVVYGSDRHSLVLMGEWNRDWRLWKLRAEVECVFKVRFVGHSKIDRTLTRVPCVLLGGEVIPLRRCGSSGEALREMAGVLTAWAAGHDDRGESISGFEADMIRVNEWNNTAFPSTFPSDSDDPEDDDELPP